LHIHSRFVGGITLVIALLSPGFSFSVPILNEVFYDGVGSDAPLVFTEILGAPGMALEKWTLIGINGATGAIYRTIDLSGGVISGDGFFVIATLAAIGETLAHRDFTAPVDWQNGPDAVQLRDPLDRIVDALQYGNAGIHNAGEGIPALDVAAGFSLSRRGGFDSGNNRNDFESGEPTPGRGTTIPEPSSLPLLTAGIVGLAFWRYRSTQLLRKTCAKKAVLCRLAQVR
jgi:hypothetical protein